MTATTGSRVRFSTVTALLAVAAASTAASYDRYSFTGYCRGCATVAAV
jgi:hypothetical protein